MNRLELRLEDTIVRAGVIKVLRKYFSDTPLSELKKIIESNDVVFSCDAGSYDEKKQMMKSKNQNQNLQNNSQYLVLIQKKHQLILIVKYMKPFSCEK